MNNNITENFNKEFYEKLFFDNPKAILIIDPNNGYIFNANKSAEKFYGWTIDELKKMNIVNIDTLTDGEIFEKIESIKNEKGGKFYFRHIIKDGSIKKIEIEFLFIENEKYLSCFIKDLSDKNSQDEIKKGEYCKEIFKKSKRGITIFQITPSLSFGNFLDSNDSISKMLGYSEDELMKMSILNIIEDYEGNSIFEMINRLKDIKKFNEIRKLVLKNGKILDFQIDYNYFEIKHDSYIQMFLKPYTKKVEKIQSKARDIYYPDFKIESGNLGIIEILNFDYIRNYYGKEISQRVLSKISNSFINKFGLFYEINIFNSKIYIATKRNKNLLLEDLNYLFSKYFKGIEIAGNSIYISLRGGFSELNYDLKDAYIRAARALRQAAISQENIVFFENQDNDLSYEYILENDLHFACKNEEFFLEYQGIYNNNISKIEKVESLIRWNHNRYGIIYPEEFIYLAEKDSTIMEIDLWVLKRSIFDLKDLIINGKILSININISYRSFSYPSFVNSVEKILANSKLPSGSIVFELTESSSLNLDIVKKIKDMGIKLAFDDFGTGFASLYQLKTMEIDILKIDLNFVKEINKNLNSTLITTAILKMAKKLEIEVVAQGVETNEQLKFLLKNGCENFQGFLIHKPSKLEDIENINFLNFDFIKNTFSKKMDFSEKMNYINSYEFGDIIYQPVDKSGIIKEVDSRFSRYLGYDPFKLKNIKISEIFDLEYRIFFEKQFNLISKGENLDDNFFKLNDKNGRGKYALISGKKDDMNGNLIHLFIEDISKKLEIGEEIQRMKIGYKTIFDEVPLSVILLNENFEVLDWNKSSNNIFGWKKEELLKNQILRYVVKNKDFYKIKNSMDRVIRGENTEILSENLTKSGQSIICNWKNKAIKNNDGDVKLILSIVTDVTEKIKREEKLIKLSMAVEQSSAAIIINDIEGNIEYVNKKYCDISGFEVNEVIGKKIRSITNEKKEDQSSTGKIWRKLKNEKEWNGEINYICKNGGSFFTRTKIFTVLDKNNKAINYISINDDITQEKEMNEKFDKINKTLIEQEKLASIGHMAAGIVHEINNPISYITTNVFAMKEMLNEDKKNMMENEFIEELKEIIDDIGEGINTVKEISQGLKKFAFRNLEKEKQVVNLNEEIKNTLIVAKNEYKYYANIVFEDTNDIFVSGYSGQLRQVFLNMIINSVYAIRKKFENEMGIIKIEIYENIDYGFIKFSDNGIGIKEENKDKIFEPFFTTKKEGEGTGLGLNITKDIIENNHHGEIILESKYGEGATFIIRIPKK